MLLQVYELSVYPHLVYLLQTQRVVPQIRFSQTPSVGQSEALQLPPDLRQPVKDWFQCVRNIFRFILGLDLLCDVEAFFKEG